MITQTSEIAAISNTADCGPREKKALVTGVQLWSSNEPNCIIPSKGIFHVLLCGSTKLGYGGETRNIWGSSNSTYGSKQKLFVFPSGGLGWGCNTVVEHLSNSLQAVSSSSRAAKQTKIRVRRSCCTISISLQI